MGPAGLRSRTLVLDVALAEVPEMVPEAPVVAADAAQRAEDPQEHHRVIR